MDMTVEGAHFLTEGDSPSPEDYCLTEDTAGTKHDRPDLWPLWYAELSDYHTSAGTAILKLDAAYRSWRAKMEENIVGRAVKPPPIARIKSEVEASKKFYQYKLAIADATDLQVRYAGWMRAIEFKISMRPE